MDKIYTDKIIDLSHLNVFEAAKMIIKNSNYKTGSKNKYKIKSANIAILKDIPLCRNIELINA